VTPAERIAELEAENARLLDLAERQAENNRRLLAVAERQLAALQVQDVDIGFRNEPNATPRRCACP
jgi:hypothetical protein